MIENGDERLIETMNEVRIIVDEKLCTGCGMCVSVCPEKAIWLDGDNIATIMHRICDLDGICIPACPVGAISFSNDEKSSGHKCGDCGGCSGNK